MPRRGDHGPQLLLSEIPDESADFVLTERQRGVVDSLLAEGDSLRDFLHEGLEANSYDVTTSESVEAYAAYCPEHRWQPLPITEVQRQVEGLMLELFGVSKGHGVDRNGKGQRGFRGVRLDRESHGVFPPEARYGGTAQ